MRTRTRLSAVALPLVAVLALSGCVPTWLSGLTGQDTSTPTGEEVEAALEPYYRQALVWERCGGGAQCATAIAPLDWDDPGAGDDIELALVRYRATDEAQGSLFVNPGGPGASGFDFVRDSVDFAVSERLRANFDVIGWDPRGVGRSSAVTCFTDPADMDEFIYGVPEAEPETPEWVAEVERSAQRFVDACAENTGPLLEHVDTDSTVRDLDMLRAVVGDEALNYFGYSYGTEIGARYADRFPDRVGRLVLDGATDPTTTQFEVVLAQSIGFEAALTTYLTECSAAASCPFPTDTTAALAIVEQLYQQLEADPIPAADGRLFTDSVLDIAVATALYDEASWEFLSQMFTELRTGVVETGFLLADFYYGRENGEYVDNSLEAFIAINCLDYPVERDPETIVEQNAAIAEAAPVTSDPSILGDVVCQRWPFAFEGQLGPVSAEGAPPILVVGTTGDPATPYVWAEALASQLDSGVLLTYDGEGHIAYDEGDPCINELVDDYFVTGAVPARDPVCAG
ncbi:alpha/beta hydrolase [Yonghaparkia sp. Root332]|uniref:alpha/beta hydrolase n=1 Tax=Yonghaparkia sp. Root332 TaxID=1736516 RepID=UPI0006FF4868|nr:alpha/beta hydrolase [Yonghaparkia sp. Root332]KQV26213.1 peptidase [Yonghaparkia sp. Root332]